jgi:hypothetical protein
MTEEEWLQVGRLQSHVDYLYEKGLVRKLRLFAAACCRHLERWIEDVRLLEAIKRVELFADVQISRSTLEKWERQVRNWHTERTERGGEWQTPQLAVHMSVSWACMSDRRAEYAQVWKQLFYGVSVYGEEFTRSAPSVAHRLLLDIFGNPFRPVAFDPSWRSESAVALARTAYDTRNFTLLPILADALEEAGCDHPDILAHCRQPDATHVRGCWVVDLVLGKS